MQCCSSTSKRSASAGGDLIFASCNDYAHCSHELVHVKCSVAAAAACAAARARGTCINRSLQRLHTTRDRAPYLRSHSAANFQIQNAHRVEAIIDSDGVPAAGVLLAAHGAGAAVCEETPVVRREAGHSWAVLQRMAAPSVMYVADAAEYEVRRV